jgi:hypothetical protein
VGSIAVLPLDKSGSKWEPNVNPDWHHGFYLKCRDGKEESFDDAKQFRVDAYRDKLNGVTVFISETGSIAVTRR